MADESVHVHIRITSDKRQIAETRRELERLAAAGRKTDSDFGDLNDTLDDHNDRHTKLQRNSRSTSSALSGNGSAASNLGNRLKKTGKDMDFLDKSRKMLSKGLSSGLKLALKGAAIEMVALGLAISTVNGLFNIGSFAMKGYKLAMGGLAYAAAAGIAALATFAAAQREYNASLTAFQYKSMPALGKGINQSMAALRNLSTDSRVAVFGMQNLNAAFAAVSKNTELTKPIQDALAGIGDFAVAAGGDIGKNFAQAAEFVGLLKKEGSLTADVLSAASKIGPQFEKALKESGKTGADEILALMSSGALAEKAGVKGALQDVNNTLMGQFKSFFTEMQGRFADLGQLFLPDVKRAFEQIQRIVRVTFMRISGSVSDFTYPKLLDDIVKVTDKLTDVFVNLFDKYLPKSQKLFGGVGKIFLQMKGWWDSFVTGLNSLRGAARVLTDSFGPVFQEIFSDASESIKMYGKLIEDNRDNFIGFGRALVTAVSGIDEFFDGFKKVIVANLPLISTLISGLGTLLGLLGKVLGGIAQVKELGIGGKSIGTGPLGPLLALAGAGGLAYGISKIAPDSRTGRIGGAIGKVGGFIKNRGGDGTSTSTGGAAGMTTAATINTRIVYLTTNKVIDRNRSGQPRPGGGGAGGGYPSSPSGLNPQGGVGSTPYGPFQPTRLQGYANRFKNFATSKTGAMGAGNRGIGKVVGMRGMGASIGAGAALAGMSHFANEDADTALAAGGMIGMVNPLAGLAVGGLGTAATSKTAKGGAMSGALGGAAAGALIGTALGGPVVGTAIGAALGVGFGATVGTLNRIAAEKDTARGLAREQSTGKFGSKAIADLYAFGPMEAQKSVDDMRDKNDRMQTIYRQFKETEGASDRDNKRVVEDMKKRGIALSEEEERLLKTEPALGAFFRSFQKQTEGMTEVGEKGFAKFGEKTKELASITGKTEKEIRGLALGMGVNLMDTTKTLADSMKDLGLATAKTAGELESFNREVYLKSFEQVFGKAKEFEESQSALNQAAEGIRQTGKGTSSEQVTDFVSVLYEQALTLNKGDAGRASAYIQSSMFGKAGGADKLQGTAFELLTGPLYDLESIFQQSLIGDEKGRTIQQALLDVVTENGRAANAAAATNALVATGGMGLQVAGGDTEGVRNAITAQMEELQRRIADPNTSEFGKSMAERSLASVQGISDTLTMSGLKGEELASLAEAEFAKIGIVADFMTQTAGDEMSTMATEAMKTIVDALGKTPEWMSGEAPSWYGAGNNPAWYNDKPLWYNGPVADTSSPRAMGDSTSSRLGRTMARHSYLDGTLPGKRSVTSSFRTNNLGSLKSDHLTGNAYDLTGQNLVGYANAVNGSGGFAEFHGSGGGRHLHVVPGQTPIGDSVSSMTPMLGGASGGGGTYTYTINVYPTDGQDAAAIAQEVMNRIESKEKSVRERS
jgi:hypothetical protein